jgi:serine protease
MPPNQTTPNDPAFRRGYQWDYEALPAGMNAVGAWQLSTGKVGTGQSKIVVAVLDTGLVFDHPDIKGSGNVVPRGYNFFATDPWTGENVDKRRPDATDTDVACPHIPNSRHSWHGTHVAAMIGAVGTNNSTGIAGVAWSASVLPVRVLGPCGSAGLSDIADGIRWAAGLEVDGIPEHQRNKDYPADIINMSLGGPRVCTVENVGELIDAINDARSAGTVVVVAAGNGRWRDSENRTCAPGGGSECKHAQEDIKYYEPAGCQGVISVAANDRRGHLAWYSNFGAVTVMAPGGDTSSYYDESGRRVADPRAYCRSHVCYPLDGVFSAVKGSYQWMQGTSQAAPHVSGAIALALAKHPTWRRQPDLIERALRASVVKPAAGACPSDKPCGAGQLDAERLLRIDEATVLQGK